MASDNDGTKEILRWISNCKFTRYSKSWQCAERLIDEGVITDLVDGKKIKIAKDILPHYCSPRWQVGIGENTYVCCVPKNLRLNSAPHNTNAKYMKLSNNQ